MDKITFRFPEKLTPYKGVLYFFFILALTHFFWKFTMNGDASDNVVTFFGLPLTDFFNAMSDHVAKKSLGVLQLFHSNAILLPDNIIQHPNGKSVQIIWACTGIKQAYIFFCIIAFYKGPWQKKLWYIPLGIFVVYLFNLLRISAIAALVENHSELFDLVHGHLLKYLFYIVIFGLWVLWEEKISGNNQKKITENEHHSI
jgi:exosortase/archaeosortase family protein